MTDDRASLTYLVYSRQKTQCAKIVTFRVNTELNDMISTAAREAGKSKSEFIRDSIVDFIKFLEDNLGVEVNLLKFVPNSDKGDRKRFDEFVVLV